MKLRSLMLAGAALAALAAGGGTAQAGPCPVLTYSDSNHLNGACNLTVTFAANGSVSTSGLGGNYDGSDDALIGVVNNTGQAISSFSISGYNIFGFDGDGIDLYIPISPNAQDTGGYGGANAFFTNIDSLSSSGTVNFIMPIAANGGTDYFSLEQPIDLASPPTIVPVNSVPEPISLALIASALAGLCLTRRQTSPGAASI